MSSAAEIATLVGASIAVVAALLAMIRYFIRNEVRPVKAEMKPNGGESFRDHIDRQFLAVHERLNGLDERLAITEDQVWNRRRVR